MQANEEVWVLNNRQTDDEQYTFVLVPPVCRTFATSPQHTMINILYSITLLLLPHTYVCTGMGTCAQQKLIRFG